MVYRPKVSEDLKDAVSKFVKEHDTIQKGTPAKNVKHTIENGCSVFFKEIDNDVIIIKRLNKVLSAFEVDFLLKNSPMLKI